MSQLSYQQRAHVGRVAPQRMTLSRVLECARHLHSATELPVATDTGFSAVTYSAKHLRLMSHSLHGASANVTIQCKCSTDVTISEHDI